MKMQSSKWPFLTTSALFLGQLTVGPLDQDKEAGINKDQELSNTILNTPVPEDALPWKETSGSWQVYIKPRTGPRLA